MSEELYKYCSFKNGLEILSSQSLKFTNPKMFNDPFEFDINLLQFDFNDLGNDIKSDFDSIKKIFIEKYGKGIQKILVDIPPKKLEDYYKQSQIEKISRSSVCCFSKEKKNIVLWSHYADKHSGVCLIFNLTFDNVFLDQDKYTISQGPVNYINYETYKPVNYLKDKLKGISTLLYTKSEDWQYENEYRYQVLDKSGFLNFKKSFLQGIIFGLRVEDDDKQKFIKNAINIGYDDLKYYHVEQIKLKIEINDFQHKT